MFAGSRAASSLAQIIAQNRRPTTCGLDVSVRLSLSFSYVLRAAFRPRRYSSSIPPQSMSAEPRKAVDSVYNPSKIQGDNLNDGASNRGTAARALKLHILGCAGGIGGRERLTTCLRIDHDIALDAGTGLCALGIDELVAIDHVFLTHFHLDHVAGLALMVDAVMGKRTSPVTVHATGEVIASLRKHLFNWELWPDFATIPNRENPLLRWSPLTAGVAVDLGGRIVTPHAVNHTRGSVAYWVHNGADGFLFSGDMSSTPALWKTFAAESMLSKVIVDCSFPNADARIAELSSHFCPQALVEEVAHMPQRIEFLIYHLKPGQEDTIMEELRAAGGPRMFAALKCGDRFDF